MVEYIKHNNQLLAILLRSSYSKEGANFFTNPEDPFQFGVLQYKKGAKILAHRHLKSKREVDLVCEALFILKGKIEVNFYDQKNKQIDSRILTAGDTILLKESGHGFRLLEDTKFIEIKQGPYLGKDLDKQYLDL